MFGLSILENILSPGYLEVKHEQCLRLRHKRSSCQLCLETCPNGAISFNGLLQVDNSLCNGCGVCVNLCPSGVFELADLPYELLLDKVSGEGVVEFACSLLPHDKGGLRVPCLGYLNEVVLTGAIVHGCQAVRLNISQCRKCSSTSGLQVALKSLMNANRILTLFGMPGRVAALSKEPGDGNSLRKDKAYSRRDFFGYLGRKTQSRVTSAIEGMGSDQEVSGKTKVTLESRLSKKHSLLLEHIKKLGQPVNDQARAYGLPFGQVEIGESCNGCGKCATFCPTGALRCHSLGDKQVIDFRLDYCSACSLCSDVCPENAITYSAYINPFNLITGGRKKLKVYRKSSCQQCRQLYITMTGSSLCHNCSKEKAVKEWLTKIQAGSART